MLTGHLLLTPDTAYCCTACRGCRCVAGPCCITALLFPSFLRPTVSSPAQHCGIAGPLHACLTACPPACRTRYYPCPVVSVLPPSNATATVPITYPRCAPLVRLIPFISHYYPVGLNYCHHQPDIFTLVVVWAFMTYHFICSIYDAAWRVCRRLALCVCMCLACVPVDKYSDQALLCWPWRGVMTFLNLLPGRTYSSSTMFTCRVYSI